MSIAPQASGTSAATADRVLAEEFRLGLSQRVADYTELCRPRIALMTMISIGVGYTLASPIVFDGRTLLFALIGIVQLVAASSILNQCLERSTDLRMVRTATRPIASGRLSLLEAVCVGLMLTMTGFAELWQLVNPATAIATLSTLLLYVVGYTLLKTRTSLCTTVGAIPGAAPPVLGWLAAGGPLGLEVLSLFAIFFVWQFPHFLAIGWIHRKDYAAAGLRMLPSFHDNGLRTGLVAMVYAVTFVPVSMLPAFVGISGNLYLWTALVLSVAYLISTTRFMLDRTTERARQLLYTSLICLPLLLIALVVDFLRLTSASY